MSIKVIRQAVDTVEVSLGGRAEADALGALERCKLLAQETEVPVPASLGGLDFAVTAQGQAPYKYRLAGPEASLRLTGSAKLPGASIRLSAEGLALYEPAPLYELVYGIVSETFGPDSPEKLSRLDIACDFQGFDPALDGARFVCAANFRPVFPNIEHPETFMFGKGDLVVRVYNKTRELKVSGKDWMRQVWEGSPDYDPTLDVWRFEVQLRRKTLRKLRCSTPQEGFAQLPELLRFGLGWCDLRVPIGESSDRWPRHEWWETLAQATGTHTTLTREQLALSLSDLDHIVPAVAGYCVSAGATTECYDFERVWSILGPKVRDRIGGGFDEAVRTRRLERLG